MGRTLSLMIVGLCDEEVDRTSVSKPTQSTLARMHRHSTELEERDVDGNDQQSGLRLRFLDAVAHRAACESAEC